MVHTLLSLEVFLQNTSAVAVTNDFLDVNMMFVSVLNTSCPSHQPMMDRNKAADLPKLQCGFIDFVCTFVYKVMFNIAFDKQKPFCA